MCTSRRVCAVRQRHLQALHPLLADADGARRDWRQRAARSSGCLTEPIGDIGQRLKLQLPAHPVDDEDSRLARRRRRIGRVRRVGLAPGARRRDCVKRKRRLDGITRGFSLSHS